MLLKLHSSSFSGLLDASRHSSGSQFRRAAARLYAGDFFSGFGDASERAAKIRQVDQRKQQTGYPENMHMREKRDKAQYGDNLKLYFLRLMRHPLGQSVQP